MEKTDQLIKLEYDRERFVQLQIEDVQELDELETNTEVKSFDRENELFNQLRHREDRIKVTDNLIREETKRIKNDNVLVQKYRSMFEEYKAREDKANEILNTELNPESIVTD